MAGFTKMKLLRSIKRKIGILNEVDQLYDVVLKFNGGGTSKSQLHQDTFALIVNGFKRNGFFVEFGATNGFELSNTHLLEHEYGWTGILAEPATMWHSHLHKNRSCFIEEDCVWSATGETLSFDMVDSGELSTISSFSKTDGHGKSRQNKTTYEVATISLADLLEKYSAPKVIDYISIDTEGSEYEILKNFDFDTYQFNLITVEHNYTPTRDKLLKLLTKNGYRRVFEHLSKWDDWYVFDR